MNGDDFFKRFFFDFNESNKNKNSMINENDNFDQYHRQMNTFIFNDMNRMMRQMDEMMKTFHLGGSFNFGFGNNNGQHFGFDFVPDPNHQCKCFIYYLEILNKFL